jgi:FAD/FMN-containing dehydrogenase
MAAGSGRIDNRDRVALRSGERCRFGRHRVSANKWLADAHNTVQTNSVGGYVNYVEPDTPAAHYFGDNLRRLKTIRQTYDPDGLMYSGMSY